jgi:hypothetical protein
MVLDFANILSEHIMCKSNHSWNYTTAGANTKMRWIVNFLMKQMNNEEI